ncbi:MAG: class I tRNA ligase family protein [Candidatus Aenigmatarchaeota archaeon]
MRFSVIDDISISVVFKITDIRQKLIEANEKVNWYPGWAKSRFDNWLNSLGDWPISRQRYWGIALPIWICEKCEKTDVIGSREELESMGAKVPGDLHRPYIDNVIIKCTCGSDMKRIPDVLDVWFDSSVASWASLGYPKDKELFENMWPADLNIEGPDQIRGWWNSQLISSMITFDKAPFKNILFHGFMLDSHGIKMAKSKGNIIAPQEVKEKYNRDLLRLYLMSTASWDDYYFNWKNADALSKQFLIIDNVFSFVNTYVPRVNTGELKPEDRWILSRLNSLISSATKHYETYHIHKATEEIMNFIINDFSRVYIKIIRDRVWPAYGGDDGAFFTLYTVCKNISRLMAPICPFFAESMHQNVLRRLGETNESIHLCNWPSVDSAMIDKDMEKYMEHVLKIIEIANNLRQEKKIKLRWPLNLMVLSSESSDVKNAVKTFKDVIKQLANVKDIKFGVAPEFREVGELKVYLDTEMTTELEQEAFVRELIRKAQDMRKKNNLIVKDRINLHVSCRPEELEGFEEMLKKEIGVKSIIFGSHKSKKDSFGFKERNVEISIEKV